MIDIFGNQYLFISSFNNLKTNIHMTSCILIIYKEISTFRALKRKTTLVCKITLSKLKINAYIGRL